MIAAVGLDVDDTFARFAAHALAADVPLKVVNLRAAVEGDWHIEVPARAPATIRQGDETIELQPDDAYYCRLIDLSLQESDVASARRWQALISGLRAWLDTVPGRVVNRGHGGAHNSSKPLHEAVLTGLGFQVPESITSCDIEELLHFVCGGPTISKTVCGIRADCVVVTEADLDGFRPENGPIHLQRFVSGADLRIHVVADWVIGQRVSSTAVDYRRAGDLDALGVFDVPPELHELVVAGTQSVGLVFAGWDFKIDTEGEYWCLEANPMPGYSPYDNRCDGAISRELLRYLGADLSGT